MAYIDDLNIIKKVRHSDAVSDLSVHKQISRAHAPQSELFFENISSHANSMGMKVNESKTQVVCISAAKNAVVRSYINANERITSADELKILGFWFSTTPGVSLHVQKTVKKFCKRLWSLRHLKRSGMSQDDLLFIYMSVLRPVIDFASIAYHTLLTKEQSETLEHLQKKVLKIIYGYNVTYDDALERANIPRSENRREDNFINFAIKASNNSSCLLYTSPSPRDLSTSRMPSSA